MALTRARLEASPLCDVTKGYGHRLQADDSTAGKNVGWQEFVCRVLGTLARSVDVFKK